ALGGTNVVDDNLFAADAGSGRGGGVGAVVGTVSVSSSAVSGNLAEGGGQFTGTAFGSLTEVAGSNAWGGGIYQEFNLGFTQPPAFMILSIADSTITGNVALASGPSANASGGGVFNTFTNTQVTDSSMSGNQAIAGPGGGFFSYHGYLSFEGGGNALGGGILG